MIIFIFIFLLKYNRLFFLFRGWSWSLYYLLFFLYRFLIFKWSNRWIVSLTSSSYSLFNRNISIYRRIILEFNFRRFHTRHIIKAKVFSHRFIHLKWILLSIFYNFLFLWRFLDGRLQETVQLRNSVQKHQVSSVGDGVRKAHGGPNASSTS